MLMNIGDKPIPSKNNLLTTVAWKVNDKTQYAFEGSIFIKPHVKKKENVVSFHFKPIAFYIK